MISTLQLQAHEVGQHAGDELQQVHQEAEEAEARLSLHQEQHTRRRGGQQQRPCLELSAANLAVTW